VPQPLTATSTLVEAVEIQPARDRATPNAGAIWIGPTSGNGTQLRRITNADVPYIVTAPPGKKIDLSQIFVGVANAGDGVVWTAVN
jgi:hypothetical protein